jgi:hypothetical protein
MTDKESHDEVAYPADNHRHEAGERWISSPLMRGVYLVEFIILAAPATIVLGYLAMVLGVVSGGAFLVGTPSALLAGGKEDVQMAVFGGIGFGLAVFGLMSFWIFVSLSFDYMRGRLEASPQARRKYRRGVFYAAIPMAILGSLAFASGNVGSDSPFPFFFLGGLVLLIPAIHLGIALHAGVNPSLGERAPPRSSRGLSENSK